MLGCGFIRTFFLGAITMPVSFFALSQQRDTIYLNANWEITEKPLASYYRTGKYVLDFDWYYEGVISDYYRNDSLQMKGSYSSNGRRNGTFSFYYDNGKLKTRGNYINNHKAGMWEYFYSDGRLQMRVEYAGNDQLFTVYDFIDSTGKVLAKDGTGSFEMWVHVSVAFGPCRLIGSFKNGTRSGTWEYYTYSPIKKAESVVLRERYEDGVFKKGTIINTFSGTHDSFKEDVDLTRLIEYEKFRATELFTKDKTVFQAKNSNDDLEDYLLRKQAPVFDVEGGDFEESFTGMIRVLNRISITRFFNDPGKIYKGEIELNVSDSGNIEEIKITGNLSEKEQDQMMFFLRKFKNIHELSVENVSIDAYHKIYFYTIIFAEFIPNRDLYNYPESQFVFAVLPYDKLREAMKDAIKPKRKKQKKSENEK